MVDPVLDPPAPAPRAPEREAVRAGSRTLSIFAYALSAQVLRSHEEGPIGLSALERTIGLAPQTSIRTALSNLCKLGVLSKLSPKGAGRGTPTTLTAAGRDLLSVADRLEQWLLRAPVGSITLDSAAASGAIRALIASWDACIVRLLAEEPLTLTELNAKIAGVSYPTIERRLARLRSAHLVTPVECKGRRKPYEASDWLRHAIAPLSAAGRWERHHMAGEAEPISEVEVEAAFLLALPLVTFPSGTFGRCALAVLTSPGSNGTEEREVAGITLDIRHGRIASCVPSPAFHVPTWALGTPDAWLDAVIDGHVGDLRLRGAEPGLALHIIRQLHEALFQR